MDAFCSHDDCSVNAHPGFGCVLPAADHVRPVGAGARPARTQSPAPAADDPGHARYHQPSHATDPAAGARLGVVSGRRRQGKTFLLRALCQATGGFYFAADEATDRESLNRLGSALADHLDAPAAFTFDTWHPAVDALLALGRDRRVPVVIDEFPNLVRANPQLPSIVQNALAPLRVRPRRHPRRPRRLRRLGPAHRPVPYQPTVPRGPLPARRRTRPARHRSLSLRPGGHCLR